MGRRTKSAAAGPDPYCWSCSRIMARIRSWPSTIRMSSRAGGNVRNSSGVVGGAGVKTTSHIDALCKLPQAENLREPNQDEQSRSAEDSRSNQRIQGPNCTNRSTRIPHPVFNPCSEPVELDSVFGNGRCQRRSARGQAETVYHPSHVPLDRLDDPRARLLLCPGFDDSLFVG